MSNIDKVHQLIEAGQLEEARDVLVDVLYEDYDNVEAWLLLTHCPQDHDEYARAIREVLRVDPENVEARRLAVELARDTTRQAAASPKRRQQQHRKKRTLQRTARTFSNLIIVLIVLGIGAFIAFLLTVTQDQDDNVNVQVTLPTIDPVVACTEQISSTLNRLQARCSFLDPNSLCLANPKVEFMGLNGALNLQFPGDRINLQQVTTLSTERFDNLNWGLIIISAQSSFGEESNDTLTLVVTSGVRLQNIDDHIERFSFSSNPVLSTCPAVPPSGILVSVPTDKMAEFEVNGAIVALQGTAFLQVDAAAGLRVTALEGIIRVEHDNFVQTVEAGEWFSWSVDPTLIVRDEPGDIMNTSDQLRGDISQLVPLAMSLELPSQQWVLPGVDAPFVFASEPSPIFEPSPTNDELIATEEVFETDLTPISTIEDSTRTPTPIPPDLITVTASDNIAETEDVVEPSSTIVSTQPTASLINQTSTVLPSATLIATEIAESSATLPDIAERGSSWRCSVILGEITFRYIFTLEPTETTTVLASGQLPNFGNTLVALDGEWILNASELTEQWTEIPGMDTTTALAWLMLEETEILIEGSNGDYGIGGVLRLGLTQDSSMSGGIFDSEQLVGFINRCELQ